MKTISLITCIMQAPNYKQLNVRLYALQGWGLPAPSHTLVVTWLNIMPEVQNGRASTVQTRIWLNEVYNLQYCTVQHNSKGGKWSWKEAAAAIDLTFWSVFYQFYAVMTNLLTLYFLRIHDFKLLTLIDHIVKRII